MSDTPRTDEATIPYYDAEQRGCVPIDFAEKLERENDQLAKQCVVFVEEIAELRKDKARIDYLVSNKQYGIIREGIDAVMEAANNE